MSVDRVRGGLRSGRHDADGGHDGKGEGGVTFHRKLPISMPRLACSPR
jgi:hypothetical protein